MARFSVRFRVPKTRCGAAAALDLTTTAGILLALACVTIMITLRVPIHSATGSVALLIATVVGALRRPAVSRQGTGHHIPGSSA